MSVSSSVSFVRLCLSKNWAISSFLFCEPLSFKCALFPFISDISNLYSLYLNVLEAC